MHTVRTFILVLLASFGAALIAGCAATDDRRSAGQFADDATITARVKTALLNKEGLREARDVNVTTYQGTVLLSGFVPSREMADRAAQVAREVGGVRDVKNDLQVTAAGRPDASTGAGSSNVRGGQSGY